MIPLAPVRGLWLRRRTTSRHPLLSSGCATKICPARSCFESDDEDEDEDDEEEEGNFGSASISYFLNSDFVVDSDDGEEGDGVSDCEDEGVDAVEIVDEVSSCSIDGDLESAGVIVSRVAVQVRKKKKIL